MNGQIVTMGCKIDNLAVVKIFAKVAGFISSKRPHQHACLAYR